jgi:acetoin utilization protein AcuB
VEALMRHPKRTITREIRTRRPLHPARGADELDALTWPEDIRVADRMTRPVATIHADALVEGAAELMRTRRIRHLPVVDRGARLVGIVTDRDLRQVIFQPAIQERLDRLPDVLKGLPVRDVMTWSVVTVRPGTGIREAARLMHEGKIGALPVVEGKRVVGILTEADVLKTFEDVFERAGLAKPYRWAFAYR